MIPRRAERVLAELKRRKVYRVVGAYIAIGVAILGAAEVILDPIGLGVARPYLVIAFLTGLPPAVVLAWVYEVRRETPSTSPDEASSRTEDVPAAENPRIAVLPFESMSPDPQGDYFADGITEELTNALARQHGLRVAARTSAFTFKDTRIDVREIGRRLNVSHVIEGSVRRTDEALRITAQLISVDDGYHVWSERYDRRHGDVFQIQEDIAGCVLGKLLGDVPAGWLPTIAHVELSAYDAFLKGRYALAQFHPLAVEEAIGHFEAAIQLDDRFAPALAGLAEALTIQSIGFSSRPTRETMPRADEAASRALELHPQLPEAHLARALTRMYRERDYPAAKAGFERALELNPNYAEAHLWEEFYWTYVRHDFEKAKAANRRAHKLSPLDTRIRGRFSTVHYLFGSFERAEELFREELADDAKDPMPHLGLADTLARVGRFEEAVDHAKTAVRLAGRPIAFLGVLSAVYGVQGDRAGAAEIVDEMEHRQRAGYTPPFWVAVALAASARIDDAFTLLERAAEERDSNLLYLSCVPRGLGLHEDPRFTGILSRIGLGHLAD